MKGTKEQRESFWYRCGRLSLTGCCVCFSRTDVIGMRTLKLRAAWQEEQQQHRSGSTRCDWSTWQGTWVKCQDTDGTWIWLLAAKSRTKQPTQDDANNNLDKRVALSTLLQKAEKKGDMAVDDSATTKHILGKWDLAKLHGSTAELEKLILMLDGVSCMVK